MPNAYWANVKALAVNGAGRRFKSRIYGISNSRYSKIQHSEGISQETLSMARNTAHKKYNLCTTKLNYYSSRTEKQNRHLQISCKRHFDWTYERSLLSNVN